MMATEFDPRPAGMPQQTSSIQPQAALPDVPRPRVLVEGIDVSHWQGVIDWKAVAGAGYRFAIIKATQGKSYRDPCFERNLFQAQEAGLLVTGYHFAEPDSNDPLAEVDNYLRAMDSDFSDLLPARLDLEGEVRLSPSHLQSWAYAWLNAVQQRTDRMPGPYSCPSYIRRNLNTADNMLTYFPLWISDPNGLETPRIAPWTTWAFWQVDCKGKVPGVQGHCDIDVYNGDYEGLKALMKPYYR